VDLDGTIMQGPFWTAVFPIVFAELARKTGLDEKEIRRQVVRENLDRQANPNISPIAAMDWDDIFDVVTERLGVRLEAQAVEIARAHAGPPDTVVLDDADRVLKQLASPQRALVVATKGLRKYQLPVLDALGLTPLFTDILTPDAHNTLKKDLAFFGEWPQAAPLRISVGDHYEDDVVAPKQFGWKSVWKAKTLVPELQQLDPFARPATWKYAAEQTVQPDAIIVSMHELPQVVERLERQ
jgi:putative hydrolase of the HAD superfamily